MNYSPLNPNDPRQIKSGLLYDPNGSAIGQMLGLLAQNHPAGQPGQPAPAPVAPMQPSGPNVSVTPDVHPGPSFTLPAPRGLLDLIAQTPGRGADIPDNQNVLGKIHDFIQNKMAGSPPPEYRMTGLLSDSEIAAEKPGIIQMLGQSGAYRTNLNHLLEAKQMAQDEANRHRIEEARQAIPSLFPDLGPNASPQDHAAQLEGMYNYALHHGDYELAKTIAAGGIGREVMRGTPNKSYKPEVFKLTDGSTQWIQPGAEIPGGAVPYHAPPRPATAGRSTGVAPHPIRIVETQLKDAEDALRRAQAIKAPGLIATDDEKAAYGNLQSQIPAMQQRRDSLRTVLDNMAGQQQGKPATGVVPPTAPNHPKDTVRSQDEYDHLTKNLHWSDAKIAATYHISPLIKRAR